MVIKLRSNIVVLRASPFDSLSFSLTHTNRVSTLRRNKRRVYIFITMCYGFFLYHAIKHFIGAEDPFMATWHGFKLKIKNWTIKDKEREKKKRKRTKGKEKKKKPENARDLEKRNENRHLEKEERKLEEENRKLNNENGKEDINE